jgi:hypothetical protein
VFGAERTRTSEIVTGEVLFCEIYHKLVVAEGYIRWTNTYESGKTLALPGSLCLKSGIQFLFPLLYLFLVRLLRELLEKLLLHLISSFLTSLTGL